MELPFQTLSSFSREKLIEYLNEFIKNDFSKVVHLLYRIDVSEAKLKDKLLQNSNQDAAELIADLILERLDMTKKARSQFNNTHLDDENEKW